MVTVNLGIGIPTLVANYVRTDIAVEFQSEMVLVMGPFPFEVRKMLISLTQKQTITTLPEHPFDSALSWNDSFSK
jgi:3-oxoacid CoA-transferase subunit B